MISEKEFIQLLLPKTKEELRILAQKAHEISLKKFGKTISLYAPLYLSNECENKCAYCSFNFDNKFPRLTLTKEQALKEAETLHQQGFRHILLVSGEAPQKINLNYLGEIIQNLKPLFPSISLEIYPLSEEGYRTLKNAGASALTIYQETYHRETYQKFHCGPKSNFDFRFQTPERGAKAGLRKVGLGFLLGLYDWKFEALKLYQHIHFLMKKYWQTQIAISFPRIRSTLQNFAAPYPVSDLEFIQLICAMRIAFPEAELVISTRENSQLRDQLVYLGINTMSAGSKTSPLGYTQPQENKGQFEVEDNRNPQEVSSALKNQGFDAMWKDWDPILG